MYQIIEGLREDVFAVIFTGNVTKDDYNKLLPILEGKIKRKDKVDIYWELNNFEGWDLEAFRKEVSFDIHNANNFNKVAIVGDKKWEELMANVTRPFTSAEVRYFDLSQRQQAMSWLQINITLASGL